MGKDTDKPGQRKKAGLKGEFGNPDFILKQMAAFVREGDVASLTDLIAVYIANSPKYNSQEEFAIKIGTSRQTLLRLLNHNDAVSLRVFFKAVEQIHEDLER